MYTPSTPPAPILEVVPLSGQIARRLRERREWHGLTQRELAERSGTRQETIARLEQGLGNPSTALVQKLFHALGYDTTIQIKPCPNQRTYRMEMRPVKLS